MLTNRQNRRDELYCLSFNIVYNEEMINLNILCAGSINEVVGKSNGKYIITKERSWGGKRDTKLVEKTFNPNDIINGTSKSSKLSFGRGSSNHVYFLTHQDTMSSQEKQTVRLRLVEKIERTNNEVPLR